MKRRKPTKRALLVGINKYRPDLNADLRGCVNRFLEFAEHQGILNAEMLARLGNKDYEQFRSAIHELAIGEFLSSIGNIDWHPPGRDSRVGEFRISPTGYANICGS